MFLGSSCCNIAENSTFARPLDFARRLNPSFHAFAEACATETLGAYLPDKPVSDFHRRVNARAAHTQKKSAAISEVRICGTLFIRLITFDSTLQ